MIFFRVVGGDIGRVKDKKNTGSGDSYRVLLIDDARHTEKLGNMIPDCIHGLVKL